MKKAVLALLCLLLAASLLPFAWAEGLVIEPTDDFELPLYEGDAPVEEALPEPAEIEVELQDPDARNEPAPHPADNDGAFAQYEKDGFWINDDGCLHDYDGPGGDIVIPEGVKSIGYDNDNYYSRNYVFYGIESTITSVKLPSTLTTIGTYAFSDCINLSTINLPDGVTKICEKAFSGCINLSSVSFPNTLTDIGESAFSGCKRLSSAVIGKGVSLGDYMFSESGIKEFTFPDGTTSIPEGFFVDCVKLTSVTIPNSVTVIEQEAFSLCKSLAGIVIPDSVTEIGASAFCECESLTKLVIGNGVTEIGQDAFFGCPFTDLTLGRSVKHIDLRAFSNCKHLKKIEFPSSLTHIDNNAFAGCESLSSISLPENLEKIGEQAFLGTGLKKVVIPDSVKSIGTMAFLQCPIVEFTFGKGLQTVNRLFTGYYGPSEFENPFYPNTTLKRLIIPNNVTTLADYAFRGCSALESVTLSDNIMEISEYAFWDCQYLEEINLPKNLKDIRKGAFRNCFLTHIELPEGTESVEECAFDFDNDSFIITIPASMIYMDQYAFGDRDDLSNVIIRGKKGSYAETYANRYNIRFETDDSPLSVALDRKGPVTLTLGQTLQLNARLSPEGSKTTLKWSSSNQGVAKVSQKGLVTPVKKGTATIKVTTDNLRSDSIVVKVIAPKPTGITITQGKSAVLYMGNKLALKTKLNPANAETTLTWRSSTPAVATVSKKGVVIPKKAGTAKITVSTANGKATQITVKVVDAKSVKLKQGKKTTLKVGKKLTLTATVSPAKVKTTLSWSSDNKRVAVVTRKGVVTAKRPGTAIITVKTANGKKATIKITVTE